MSDMMSDKALARLAVAWEACELSEAARSAVASDDPVAVAPEVLEAALRFSRAVAELAQYEGVGRGPNAGGGWWRENLRRHPEEAAQDLDDWVIRHQDGEDPGPAPVSTRLHQVADGK
jgi:hypothetical protein